MGNHEYCTDCGASDFHTGQPCDPQRRALHQSWKNSMREAGQDHRRRVLELMARLELRPVREISAAEEQFRVEPVPGASFGVIRRNPVEPEPVGTFVLKAFRITGYDHDCDGSLMARLENVDSDLEATGWDVTHLGLYPGSTVVVSAPELRELFAPVTLGDRETPRAATRGTP